MIKSQNGYLQYYVNYIYIKKHYFFIFTQMKRQKIQTYSNYYPHH